MPCSDTTSSIICHLDKQDKLVDFSFSKITCAKPIVSDQVYMDSLKGKTLEDILSIHFGQWIKKFNIVDEEESFFCYLTLEALQGILRVYQGEILERVALGDFSFSKEIKKKVSDEDSL